MGLGFSLVLDLGSNTQCLKKPNICFNFYSNIDLLNKEKERKRLLPSNSRTGGIGHPQKPSC